MRKSRLYGDTETFHTLSPRIRGCTRDTKKACHSDKRRGNNLHFSRIRENRLIKNPVFTVIPPYGPLIVNCYSFNYLSV